MTIDNLRALCWGWICLRRAEGHKIVPSPEGGLYYFEDRGTFCLLGVLGCGGSRAEKRETAKAIGIGYLELRDLEAGFEGWSHSRMHRRNRKFLINSPYFKLGQELARKIKEF